MSDSEVIEMTIRGTDRVVLIDKADLPLVQQYSWRYSPHSKTPKFGYVVTTTSRKKTGQAPRTVSMHRLLLGEPLEHVDHISGDRMDNRRCNLRLASRSQNMFNTAKKSSAIASKYKGVTWSSQHNRWMAKIQYHGVSKYLGLFDDEALAGLAYDRAALGFAGEFARTNFPASIVNLCKGEI